MLGEYINNQHPTITSRTSVLYTIVLFNCQIITQNTLCIIFSFYSQAIPEEEWNRKSRNDFNWLFLLALAAYHKEIWQNDRLFPLRFAGRKLTWIKKEGGSNHPMYPELYSIQTTLIPLIKLHSICVTHIPAFAAMPWSISNWCIFQSNPGEYRNSDLTIHTLCMNPS